MGSKFKIGELVACAYPELHQKLWWQDRKVVRIIGIQGQDDWTGYQLDGVTTAFVADNLRPATEQEIRDMPFQDTDLVQTDSRASCDCPCLRRTVLTSPDGVLKDIGWRHATPEEYRLHHKTPAPLAGRGPGTVYTNEGPTDTKVTTLPFREGSLVVRLPENLSGEQWIRCGGSLQSGKVYKVVQVRGATITLSGITAPMNPLRFRSATIREASASGLLNEPGAYTVQLSKDDHIPIYVQDPADVDPDWNKKLTDEEKSPMEDSHEDSRLDSHTATLLDHEQRLSAQLQAQVRADKQWAKMTGDAVMQSHAGLQAHKKIRSLEVRMAAAKRTLDALKEKVDNPLTQVVVSVDATDKPPIEYDRFQGDPVIPTGEAPRQDGAQRYYVDTPGPEREFIYLYPNMVSVETPKRSKGIEARLVNAATWAQRTGEAVGESRGRAVGYRAAKADTRQTWKDRGKALLYGSLLGLVASAAIYGLTLVPWGKVKDYAQSAVSSAPAIREDATDVLFVSDYSAVEWTVVRHDSTADVGSGDLVLTSPDLEGIVWLSHMDGMSEVLCLDCGCRTTSQGGFERGKAGAGHNAGCPSLPTDPVVSLNEGDYWTALMCSECGASAQGHKGTDVRSWLMHAEGCSGK